MCRLAERAQLLNFHSLFTGLEPPSQNAVCKRASRRKSLRTRSATASPHSTPSVHRTPATWKLGVTLLCCLLAPTAPLTAATAATAATQPPACSVNSIQELLAALVNTQCATLVLEGQGLVLTQLDWMAAATRTAGPSVQYGQATVSRNVTLRGARSGSTVLDCGHLKARVALAANVTFRIQNLILLNCRQPSAPGVNGLDLWVVSSGSTLTVEDSILQLDVCPPLGAMSSAMMAAPRPVARVGAAPRVTQSVRLGIQLCLPDALLEPNCWAASVRLMDYASEGTSLAPGGGRVNTGLVVNQNTSLVCAEHDGSPACSSAAAAVLMARSLSAVAQAAAEHNLWGCVAGSVVNLGLASWNDYDMPHVMNGSALVDEAQTRQLLAIALPSIVVGMVLLFIFLGLAIWDRQRLKFSPKQEVVKEAYEGVVFVGLSEGSDDGHPDGLDCSCPTGPGSGSAIKRKAMTAAMAVKAMALATSSEGAWSDPHCSPRSWKQQDPSRTARGPHRPTGLNTAQPGKGQHLPMVGISVLPPSPVATSPPPVAVPTSRMPPPRAGAATTAAITRAANSSGGGAPINLANIASQTKATTHRLSDAVSLLRRSPHGSEGPHATGMKNDGSGSGGQDRRSLGFSTPASMRASPPKRQAGPGVAAASSATATAVTSPRGTTMFATSRLPTSPRSPNTSSTHPTASAIPPAPIGVGMPAGTALRYPTTNSRIPTSPRSPRTPRSPLPPPSSPSLLPLPPPSFLAALSPPLTVRSRSPFRSPSPTPSAPLEDDDPLPPPIPLNLIPGLDVRISNHPAYDRAPIPHASVLQGTMGRLPVTVRLLHRDAAAGGSSYVGPRGLQSEMVELAGLQHPNLLMVLGMGEGPGMGEVFLVEEVAAASLARVCHEGGGLSLERALRVARDVAAGLSYIHSSGLEHGNLKPSSVLLDSGGNAKLTDFGLPRLAAAATDNAVTESATVPYMAPECVRSRVRRNTPAKSQLSAQADIYSFGVLLWEMLSREKPWRGLNAVQVAMAVGQHNRHLEIPTTDRFPSKVRKLLQQCWEEDPKKRPSAADLLKRLSGMVQPQQQQPQQQQQQQSRPRR